jgi:hypothetical protein
MPTRITVNGVEYRSVEEMPPDVRAEYDRMMSLLADRNNDGGPDILEDQHVTAPAAQSKLTASVSKVTRININGQKYDRWEDVPPELRQMIDQAQAKGEKTTIIETRTTSPLVQVGRATGQADGEGITIRLTWSALFGVLSVVGLIILAYWLTR